MGTQIANPACVAAVLFALASPPLSAVSAADAEFFVRLSERPSVSVVMENRWLRVRHGSTEKTRGAILELLDKRTGYDAAGNAASIWQTLDNSAKSAPLTSARMVKQTSDEISVEFNWGTGVKRPTGWDGENKREVITIYRDSAVLRLHYITKWHIYEWGAERTTGDGAYCIVGARQFQAGRGLSQLYFNHQEFTFDPKGVYYNRERDGLDVPLNYHGHIIMGITNSHGRGFVRVMSLAALPNLKLMGVPPCGFEMYRVVNDTVGYLAPVGGGAAEIETLGKAIADWAQGGERPRAEPAPRANHELNP